MFGGRLSTFIWPFTRVLLCGLVTSTGVAWVIAAKAPWQPSRLSIADRLSIVDRPARPARGAWLTRRCFGCEYIHAVYLPPRGGQDLAAQFEVNNGPSSGTGVFRLQNSDYDFEQFSRVGPLPLPRQLVNMIEMAPGYTEFMIAGWPTKSLFSKSVYGGQPSTTGAMLFRGNRLPVLPLWPGFAINTALFAAPWVPIFGLGVWMRRRSRRRRGLCPMCGYSRSGLAADKSCPECGTEAKTLSYRQS